jgi:hypothetical protein
MLTLHNQIGQEQKEPRNFKKLIDQKGLKCKKKKKKVTHIMRRALKGHHTDECVKRNTREEDIEEHGNTEPSRKYAKTLSWLEDEEEQTLNPNQKMSKNKKEPWNFKTRIAQKGLWCQKIKKKTYPNFRLF